MARPTKPEVTALDESRVLSALRDAPSGDTGIPAVSLGCRCGKAGTPYAQRVLEHLLRLGKVERLQPPERDDKLPRQPWEELWRAIER